MVSIRSPPSFVIMASSYVHTNVNCVNKIHGAFVLIDNNIGSIHPIKPFIELFSNEMDQHEHDRDDAIWCWARHNPMRNSRSCWTENTLVSEPEIHTYSRYISNETLNCKRVAEVTNHIVCGILEMAKASTPSTHSQQRSAHTNWIHGTNSILSDMRKPIFMIPGIDVAASAFSRFKLISFS